MKLKSVMGTGILSAALILVGCTKDSGSNNEPPACAQDQVCDNGSGGPGPGYPGEDGWDGYPRAGLRVRLENAQQVRQLARQSAFVRNGRQIQADRAVRVVQRGGTVCGLTGILDWNDRPRVYSLRQQPYNDLGWKYLRIGLGGGQQNGNSNWTINCYKATRISIEDVNEALNGLVELSYRSHR